MKGLRAMLFMKSGKSKMKRTLKIRKRIERKISKQKMPGLYPSGCPFHTHESSFSFYLLEDRR